MIPDGEIDGDIEDTSAFGKIHAQKENVAPTAVRQVHPYGGTFMQERIQAVGLIEHRRNDAQRVIRRMSGPEHPLISTH